jgi:hypothetical protein
VEPRKFSREFSEALLNSLGLSSVLVLMVVVIWPLCATQQTK